MLYLETILNESDVTNYIQTRLYFKEEHFFKTSQLDILHQKKKETLLKHQRITIFGLNEKQKNKTKQKHFF